MEEKKIDTSFLKSVSTPKEASNQIKSKIEKYNNIENSYKNIKNRLNRLWNKIS